MCRHVGVSNVRKGGRKEGRGEEERVGVIQRGGVGVAGEKKRQCGGVGREGKAWYH